MQFNWVRTVVTAGLVAAMAALSATPAKAQDNRSYLLATAGTGGTYYPVGVALATLVKIKLEPRQGIAMSAITSAGSGENVKLLRENQAQFAIVQGLFGAYAANGTGPLADEGAQENMRAVTMLWQNVEHFAIRRSFVDTGTVDDLIAMQGETFAIGRMRRGQIDHAGTGGPDLRRGPPPPVRPAGCLAPPPAGRPAAGPVPRPLRPHHHPAQGQADRPRRPGQGRDPAGGAGWWNARGPRRRLVRRLVKDDLVSKPSSRGPEDRLSAFQLQRSFPRKRESRDAST